jgi:hypothetical protein
LKILLTFGAKQTILARRSIVLGLPIQLVVCGKALVYRFFDSGVKSSHQQKMPEGEKVFVNMIL